MTYHLAMKLRGFMSHLLNSFILSEQVRVDAKPPKSKEVSFFFLFLSFAL